MDGRKMEKCFLYILDLICKFIYIFSATFYIHWLPLQAYCHYKNGFCLILRIKIFSLKIFLAFPLEHVELCRHYFIENQQCIYPLNLLIRWDHATLLQYKESKLFFIWIIAMTNISVSKDLVTTTENSLQPGTTSVDTSFVSLFW